MCMGHSAISTTSIAGKQPLFNLHQPNLRGCSIHQGQLPTQSAGGYLHSPCSALVQTSSVSSVMNQGVGCTTAQKAHSGARSWVVWLFDTAQHRPGSRCTVSATMLLSDADFRSFASNGWPPGVESRKEISAREDKVAWSIRPHPNWVWSARFCLHVLLCDPF